MTISVVQATAKNATSNTISATGAGNALFVCVNSFSGSASSISSVKLGTTNLTQALTDFSTDSGFTDTWIYYLANIAAGQTSVVVTGSNLTVDSSNGGVDIIEVSGLALSSMLDKSNHANGSSTAFSSGSSGTLSQSDEFVLGTACGFNMSSPSGWTMVSGGGTARRTGYKIVSATTAQTFNASMTLAGWAAGVASFKGGVARPKGLLPFLIGV